MEGRNCAHKINSSQHRLDTIGGKAIGFVDKSEMKAIPADLEFLACVAAVQCMSSACDARREAGNMRVRPKGIKLGRVPVKVFLSQSCGPKIGLKVGGCNRPLP